MQALMHRCVPRFMPAHHPRLNKEAGCISHTVPLSWWRQLLAKPEWLLPPAQGFCITDVAGIFVAAEMTAWLHAHLSTSLPHCCRCAA